MLIRFLPVALLAAGATAQVYDNGPLETSPSYSTLQNTTLAHTVYGYGGQLIGTTTDNSCFDNFVVCQAMVVDEVEFFCYQTGSTTTSTITGAYIAFYDSDPSTQAVLTPMAGSPLPTFDQFSTPNNPVSNAWSGVYRDLESGPLATNRPIMAVRVKLEDSLGNATPLVLLPGTYWLEVQASGSLASGPWLPPVTVSGQGVTGDAMQLIGTTSVFNNPIVSGVNAQAIPFKLYGAASTAGTIAQVATGCGSTGISVNGAPNVGGFIRTELTQSNVGSGIPIIGYDFGAGSTAFCGCTAIHAFPIALWFATAATIDIPLDPGFCGLTIGIQGAEFNGIGGCPSPALTFTDGYLVTVNT
jgi:hypothetical protein